MPLNSLFNDVSIFCVQSDRFFNALKGHGALCRLVVLPFESHGYSARESILHVLWETDTWLQKYCVNNPDKPTVHNDESGSSENTTVLASGSVPDKESLHEDEFHYRRRSLLW